MAGKIKCLPKKIYRDDQAELPLMTIDKFKKYTKKLKKPAAVDVKVIEVIADSIESMLSGILGQRSNIISGLNQETLDALLGDGYLDNYDLRDAIILGEKQPPATDENDVKNPAESSDAVAEPTKESEDKSEGESNGSNGKDEL